MASGGTQTTKHLGFLTAVETQNRGFVAGLLVTNHLGRPLEFQCTTPVKPNRTQEILYGPTLVPFLMGELLGRTLVEKVGVKPHVVLTNRPDMLDLRHHVSIPVAELVENEADASQERTAVQIGRDAFQLHAEFGADVAVLSEIAKLVADKADMREPFERVLEALRETMGAAAA